MAAYSLLRAAQEITGLSHGDLASIVGVSRPLVQKVCAGSAPEYLTADQKAKLIEAVRAFVQMARDGLETMELML